ncbi:hypothetical protein CHS0354_023627 [Potamilus streckersoni]|uniref:Uncharacterized protein n=1 Tax=Potamilus streckersoni TaxID=2493646 RepID=A0AAE0W463_9BIVA|nr:hypothetical protein CHS0354_023627 [Potamilus streckersoni]
MATANHSELVYVGTVELEHVPDLAPNYSSLVVLSHDKVIVLDNMAGNLRLHSILDGQLLAVYDKLESAPCDICICSTHDNEIKMAVWLETCPIEILSIKFTGLTSTITTVRKLDIMMKFDDCQGVKYLNEKLLICGRQQYNRNDYSLCWCIVSVTDGHVDKVNTICNGEDYSLCYMSTNPQDDNMVYVSCDAGIEYPSNTGVYGYRNSTLEFLYQHKNLDYPRGITVDRWGYIFVCNYYSPCIHHLTEKGQLVTVYLEGMTSDPSAIFWEEQQGLLYITKFRTNLIAVYRPVYHQGGHKDPELQGSDEKKQPVSDEDEQDEQEVMPVQ